MGRSTGSSGHASRYTLRACAVGILVIGVVGAAKLAAYHESARAAAEEEARLAAVQEFSRRFEDQTDRQLERRTAIVDAAEVADDWVKSVSDRVERAEEAADRRLEASRVPPPPARPNIPIPSSCDEYSGNRAIGCAMLLDAGFSLDEMPCLDSLWTKESGWNHLARNGSSGAYGIPQAYPGSKMASHGADWETNPATQIAWGLSYISGRYGTPCNAYQFSQANGYY